jgi:hypothetical protein
MRRRKPCWYEYCSVPNDSQPSSTNFSIRSFAAHSISSALGQSSMYSSIRRMQAAGGAGRGRRRRSEGIELADTDPGLQELLKDLDLRRPTSTLRQKKVTQYWVFE